MVHRLALVGLILAAIGAALDFISGTLMLQAAFAAMMPNMLSAALNATIWSVPIYIFGGLLITTGALGATRVGAARMRVFGELMAIYGIVMLFIGGLMLAGVTPMMQGAVPLSIAMFAVGLAMIINGRVMTTRRGMKGRKM